MGVKLTPYANLKLGDVRFRPSKNLSVFSVFQLLLIKENRHEQITQADQSIGGSFCIDGNEL